MTDRKREPPPGWVRAEGAAKGDPDGYMRPYVQTSGPDEKSLDEAWAIYDRETAPAVAQRMDEVAAWLVSEDAVRYFDDRQGVDISYHGPEIAAALLERFGGGKP